MTEQNTAVKSNSPEAQDEDPLAELARIVSGEQPASTIKPKLRAVPSASDDISMDLEAELMQEAEEAGDASMAGEDADQAASDADLELAIGDQLVQELSAEANAAPAYDDSEERIAKVEAQMEADLALVEKVTQEASREAGKDIGPAANDDGFDFEAHMASELEADFAKSDAAAETDAPHLVLRGASQEESVIPAPPFSKPLPISEVKAEIAQNAASPGVDFGEEFSATVNQMEANQVKPAAGEDAVAEESNLQNDFETAFARELDFEVPELASASSPAAQQPVGQSPLEAPKAESADSTIADQTSVDPGSLDTHEIDNALLAADSSGPKGFKLALGALGIALVAGLGVVGFGAMKGAETSGGDAVVIAADSEPLKVKPEDPGGTVIANTDNKAYESVSGGATEETTQETLISSREQPIEIAKADESTPTQTAKNDSRLTPETEGGETSQVGGVSAKRVKTLTIKPDGSIVRTTAPAAESAATETATGIGSETQTAALVPESGNAATENAAQASADTSSGEPEILQPVAVSAGESATSDTVQLDGAVSTGRIPVPQPSPIAINSEIATQTANSTEPEILKPVAAKPAVAEARPKPVVREAAPEPKPEVDPNAPTQIAALPAATDAATPPATSGWSVQVSSQRSPEEAEASYANLRNRFGSILGNRGKSVQRAVVEGKGTFFRVRIPATSKEDASNLCASLKRAGGSCFITR